MNIINFIRDKHALLFKVILYLLSSFLLTYLLPGEQRYAISSIRQLNYWPYPALVAKQDFYVKKTDKELSEEQKRIKIHSALYYKEDVREKETKLHELENTITLSKRNNDLLLVKKLLDTLYRKGIIEETEHAAEGKAFYTVINGQAEQNTMDEYYTIESALSWIENRLKNHPRKSELTETCLNHLAITLYFDEALTNKVTAENVAAISLYKNSIARGETLIEENEPLTNEKRELLLSYLSNLDALRSNEYANTGGRLMISLLLFGILLLYLAFFRKNIFGQNKHIAFIFMLVIISALVSKIISSYGVLFFWSIPFALIAVLIRIFFDSRTAMFVFLISVLFCAFFANDKFQFVFIQLTIGMGTVFSMAEMRRRKELLFSSLVVFIFYLFAFIAFMLANDKGTVLTQKIVYLPVIISSLLILLAFPSVFFAEKVFGFISDFTLMELCDLNSPLLRELSLKVPGTFQHSLQVANLAEEAIFHIGGNALLVRAGAMYHDIGKMENPRYFTENQTGEINPHSEILPEESAKIIISHVIKGVEIAKKYTIPEAVIDFIRTHHGTTMAGFFLHNFKKEHKDERVNEEVFRYPGPIPFSKETAVLMMADGVEAASRSLKKYDAYSINELVDRIIDYKISENQFINAEITFKDITIVKKIFKKRLMNMYHVRIEYPR